MATVATTRDPTPLVSLAGARPTKEIVLPTMVEPSTGANTAMMGRASTPPTITLMATLERRLRLMLLKPPPTPLLLRLMLPMKLLPGM
jgi:hypothetical protein